MLVEKMMTRRKFLRRAAALGMGTAIAAPILAACGPTPTPQVVKETVVVEKAVTQIVQKEVTKIVAGTPVTVKETVVVEKPVTKVVEKEVIKEVTAVKQVVELRYHDNQPLRAPAKATVDLFQTRNPDIKIKVEAVPLEDYWAKMRTLYAGKQLGDVMYTWHERGYFEEYYRQGFYQPIDKYVKAEGYDLSVYFPQATELFTKEGKLYLMPGHFHPGPTGYHINLDMCDAAGITYVDKTPPEKADINDDWSTDQFAEVAKKLTVDNDKDGKPEIWGFTGLLNIHFIASHVRTFGGDILAPGGKEPAIDSPQCIEAIKFFSGLVNNLKVAPPPGTLEDSETNVFLTGKKLAILKLGITVTMQLPLLVKGRFRFTNVLLPRHPKTGNRGMVLSLGGWGTTTQSQHPDETWRFLKHLGSLDWWMALFKELGTYDPGAIKVTWYHPDVTAVSRVVKPFADKLLPLAKPHIYAWNGRSTEVETAITQAFQKTWLGKTSPEEGCKEAAATLKEILAKPPV